MEDQLGALAQNGIVLARRFEQGIAGVDQQNGPLASCRIDRNLAPGQTAGGIVLSTARGDLAAVVAGEEHRQLIGLRERKRWGEQQRQEQRQRLHLFDLLLLAFFFDLSSSARRTRASFAASDFG